MNLLDDLLLISGPFRLVYTKLAINSKYRFGSDYFDYNLKITNWVVVERYAGSINDSERIPNSFRGQKAEKRVAAF